MILVLLVALWIGRIMKRRDDLDLLHESTLCNSPFTPRPASPQSPRHMAFPELRDRIIVDHQYKRGYGRSC